MSSDIAIYVHWPFCESKCPYCDFNSHVTDTVNHAAWCAALCAELKHYAAETAGRAVGSLFFGGGTPSLMDPATVSAIIDTVAQHWGWADNPEITLEANPSSTEVGRFRNFRAAGVNRLSLGVQSLNNASLAFLGRRHDALEARQALADAAAVFDRFSFDMIYGLPDQTVQSWQSELVDALHLAGGHLSVYQLTIEPGTPFFRDRIQGVGEDAAVDMFELTRSQLADAGLPAYEVSNHARPGFESRHNLNYWRGGDYIGIGPGAHGRLSTMDGFIATHQIHQPARWLDLMNERGHGTAKRRRLETHERAEEMIMTGLRLSEGLNIKHVEEITNLSWDQCIDPVCYEQCLSGGLLRRDGDWLIATPSGLLRLNAMLAAMLAPNTDEG
jgi:putative oxygen-independent coproporphyrinogen III oxidase